MLYLERPPSPALRPFIKTLWYCRAPAPLSARERVLPTGCMQILINLSRDYLTDCGDDGTALRRQPRTLITGARARFEIIDTADLDNLAGIVLQPGGFAPLFQERADLLFEQSVPLECLWRGPRLIEPLFESLFESLCAAPTPAEKLDVLDRLLLRLIQPATLRSELVDHALFLFGRRGHGVSACARSIGVSERRLSQVFREQVGLSPKLWCRIQRFQSATRALHRGADMPWAQLAIACGYYDQAHFANDFKAFSGIDPTTYSTSSQRWQNHVPVV